MRFTSLEIRNLFSFEEVRIDLGADHTYVIGPNGAGKTNLLRAIDVIGTALEWAATGRRISAFSTSEPEEPAAQRLTAYSQMRHQGRDAPAAIRLGLALTERQEAELVVAFLRAAAILAAYDARRRSSPMLPSRLAFAEKADSWTRAQIFEESISPLSNLCLVAEHSGVPGEGWEVYLELSVGSSPSGSESRLIWTLRGSMPPNILILRSHRDPSNREPLRSFAEALGLDREDEDLQLPSWSFRSIANQAPCGPILLGQSHQLQPLPWEVPAAREFLTLLGTARPVANQSSLSTGVGIAHVYHHLWQRSVFRLDEQLRGIGPWASPVTPVGTYDLGQLATALNSTEPALLPARLFRLANGEPEEQRRYRNIRCIFFKLARTRLHLRAVPEAARPPQATQASEAPTGRVVVDLLTEDTRTTTSDNHTAKSNRMVPIYLAGAGRWESLLIAEALAAPRGCVVLMDEPAANLHPSWQHTLATYLSRQLVQSLTITHAAAMLPLHLFSEQEKTRAQPDQPPAPVGLLRVSMRQGSSNTWRVANESLAEVAPRLVEKGNEALLFADKVVLVEGQSDLEVVRIIAMKESLSLEGPRSAIIECGGRESLRKYIKTCNELAIRYLAIMDGDGSKAKDDPSVAQKVNAVREEVNREIGELLEFKEDIEHAFGLDGKDRPELREQARETSYEELDADDERHRLYCALKKFAKEG